MSQRPGRRLAAGFSIIEMAVVVAVLAIMIGFGVPSFREFLTNYRTSAQANDLIADVAFARGEAAKLGRTVQVVATGGDWNNGWIVGADLDASGSISGTEQFRQHGARETGFDIKAGNSVTAISFGPAGQLTVPTTGSAEFAVCQPAGYSKHRAVIVNQVGRAEIRKWGGSSFGTGATVTCP